MVRIREDIDFNDCTISEVVKAYWTDSSLRLSDKNYGYYWWRVGDKKKIDKLFIKKMGNRFARV